MDIIKTIRENKLIYLTHTKLIEALNIITGEPLDELSNSVQNLIASGDLFLDENGKISISSDKGYIKAKLTLNKKGFGFAVVEGKPDFFIPAFAINGAFDGDNVLVEITSLKTEESIEARVVKVLKRNTTRVVGTFIMGKSKNVVFPDDVKLPQIRIFKGDNKNAKNNDKVYVELDINSIETKTLRGKVIEVLGQANNPKAEQLSIIRSYNLIEKFDDDTLAAANKISQNVNYEKEKTHRADYTAQRVITIDGEDARDFDDAISIEKLKNGGYNLYVHIADVSNYVTENSPLDKEAYRRGTSAYFPNLVIPMLPKELSNGICSLKENEYRLTMSVKMVMDKNFNVIDSELNESIIKSCHRMTYTEITGILAEDELLKEKFADVYEDILLYRTISNKFKAERLARGEIRFNIPEPFILENSAGEIVSIENRVQDESHEIIESLMIKANEIVAEIGTKLPFVFRVHEKPDELKVKHLSELLKNMGVANNLVKDGDQPMSYQKIVDKIKDTPKERTLTKLILRTMMKARYHTANLGHFGLASTNYCHFTSPIRRYPDLMIHRILKSMLHGTPKEEIKIHFAPIVERASVQASETEKRADEAERTVDDYKKAVYMTKFIGEEFPATISGVQEFGIFVELENGIEGLVRLDSLPFDEYQYDEMSMSLHGKNHHYTIGDELKVVVANANPVLRQVDFDIAGVEKSLSNFVVNVNKDKKSKLGSNLDNKTLKKAHPTKDKHNKQPKSHLNKSYKTESYKTRKEKNKNKSKHKKR